ncbi:hypothetical protein ABIE89_004441 [Bradyrhizobium niftali]
MVVAFAGTSGANAGEAPSYRPHPVSCPAQAGHPVRRDVYWFAPSVAAAYWIVRLR